MLENLKDEWRFHRKSILLKVAATILLAFIPSIFPKVWSEIYQNFLLKIPVPLKYLAFLFLILILLLQYSYINHLADKIKLIKLKTNKFNLLWDDNKNPYCQKCDNILVDFIIPKNNSLSNPHFKCHKCEHKNFLKDETGKILTFEEAKKLL